MVIRKNLDVPYDLSLVIDNIEVLHQIEKSQSLIFTPLLNNEEYLNLTNQMKS